jgi:dUTP pyrophosphatase
MMMMLQPVKVKIINKSANLLPQYATEGASGMDIRANNDEQLLIKPMERKLVPTGIFLEIPHGYEAQIRPRSGLAVNKGLTCLNTPGTIDSDYRGEVKVLLINLSNEEQTIVYGDRIAQMVFAKIEVAQLIEVTQLNETQRAAGGFGHTGIK